MAKAKCFHTYFLQKRVKFVEIDFDMFSDNRRQICWDKQG